MKSFIRSIFLALCVLYASLCYQDYKEKYSTEFFTFYFTKESHFVKDKKEVILLGMNHIANNTFYENIKKDYYQKEFKKPITLMEGVSDKKKIMKIQFPYKKEALKLGLTPQSDSYWDIFPNPVLSDLDFSDINPKEVALLKKSFLEMNQKDQPNTQLLFNVMCKFDCDILHKRNKKIISMIKKSKKYDTIIIPFGANHLPEIENYLLSQGYTIKSTKLRYSSNILLTKIKSLIHENIQSNNKN